MRLITNFTFGTIKNEKQNVAQNSCYIDNLN